MTCEIDDFGWPYPDEPEIEHWHDAGIEDRAAAKLIVGRTADKRERRVLELRFLRGWTREEIASRFNLSRERIAQLERRAIWRWQLRVSTDQLRLASLVCARALRRVPFFPDVIARFIRCEGGPDIPTRRGSWPPPIEVLIRGGLVYRLVELSGSGDPRFARYVLHRRLYDEHGFLNPAAWSLEDLKLGPFR